MARLSQPDPKYAPKNYAARVADAGVTPHHQAVLDLLAHKTRKRSAGYAADALAFVNEWRANHRESYDREKPGEIALATIVAVSIRRKDEE